MEILEYRLDRLMDEIKTRYGKGRYHAEAVYRQIFKTGRIRLSGLREFEQSPALAQSLEKTIQVSPGRVTDVVRDGELTKFITQLSDGLRIESVIIPMTRHQTLCVSSQVGCRMGCRFCRTAKMGFQRSLEPHEIVGQLFNARFVLMAEIKNIVFMGMGEPFDNFSAVMQAVHVMNEQKGLDVAFRHITLSTAGLIGGIRALADKGLTNIRLAVSINSADETLRSQIMPVSRANSLKDLKEALMAYRLPKRGTFLFEYILIKGLNDSLKDAIQLAEYINPMPVRLNLIPYNPVGGFDFGSVDDAHMHQFADMLTDQGVFVVKRWSKGQSVGAGCGQLGGAAC